MCHPTIAKTIDIDPKLANSKKLYKSRIIKQPFYFDFQKILAEFLVHQHSAQIFTPIHLKLSIEAGFDAYIELEYI